MKTVCVFANIIVAGQEMEVVEHAVFGNVSGDGGFATASCFITYCQNMWKKHASSYKITNVVIEG